MGLGIFLGPVFYKYVAPTALEAEYSGCRRVARGKWAGD